MEAVEMSPEEISTLLQRFALDPWNTGDLTGLDDTTTEDYFLHGEPGQEAGRLSDLKDTIRTYRAAFPDLLMTVEETIAQEDRLAYRWTMRGTHQGEFDGIAPTGGAVTFSGITIVHLQDGRISEDRYESSSPSTQQQLTT
ncbi:hypothetical protein GTQ99_05395 [Kineococcus sp. T13]|uniref:ester cyclase n=1 Tax=Kineococcus vitellinus TaxID=2696565 RepID=UPI001412A1C1|nr:ester cyclase [Kineococcus vitellinus]NAZ74860.1 hypothetical protein [Kineococcus vitellinus]